MGRGIPTALLGRKLKTGGHANKTDAGMPKVVAPKVVAPKVVAPKVVAPTPEAEPSAASMENTKAELIAIATAKGVVTKGLTKAQLVAAIQAA